MEKNPSNVAHCIKLIKQFDSLKMRHPPGDLREMATEALVDGLLEGCTSPEIATEIAGYVLREEEFYPAVATFRKRLREHNYIEEDTAREAHDRFKAKMAEENAEREGWRGKAGGGIVAEPWPEMEALFGRHRRG